MKRLSRTRDPPAERLPNTLMAKTDAQNRQVAGHSPDEFERDPGEVGRAGARRQHDCRCTLRHADQRIVAHRDGLFTQLVEVAANVVDEAVVVVDDEDHGSSKA